MRNQQRRTAAVHSQTMTVPPHTGAGRTDFFPNWAVWRDISPTQPSTTSSSDRALSSSSPYSSFDTADEADAPPDDNHFPLQSCRGSEMAHEAPRCSDENEAIESHLTARHQRCRGTCRPCHSLWKSAFFNSDSTADLERLWQQLGGTQQLAQALPGTGNDAGKINHSSGSDSTQQPRTRRASIMTAMFQWRTVQHKLCYNPRPFSLMSDKMVKSYNRLVTIFELNWTLVEPLECCASEVHPIVWSAAAPVPSGSPVVGDFCSCTGLKASDRERIVLPSRAKNKGRLSRPEVNAMPRPYSHGSVDSGASYATARTRSVAVHQSTRYSTASTVGPKAPSCHGAAHRHYILFPFILESRRCVVHRVPKTESLPSSAPRVPLSESSSKPHTCPSSTAPSKSGDVAVLCQKYEALYDQQKHHSSSPIRKPPRSPLTTTSAPAPASFYPSFPHHARSVTHSLATHHPRGGCSLFESRVLPKQIRTTQDDTHLQLNGASLVCRRNSYAALFRARCPFCCPEDYEAQHTKHVCKCADGGPSSSTTETAEPQAYLHHQRCHLNLWGWKCPPDVLAILLALPETVARHFRHPASCRRAFLERSGGSTNAPSCPAWFSRLVRACRTPLVWPSPFLYIQTRPLTPPLLQQHNEEEDASLCDKRKGVIGTSSADLHRRVCLIVFCAGKDMVAFDWLPIVSRFYTFMVNEENRLDQTAPEAPASKRSFCSTTVDPLVPFGSYLKGTSLSPSEQGAQSANSDSLKLNFFTQPRRYAMNVSLALIEYPGSGQSCGPPSVQASIESATQCVGRALHAITERLNPSSIEVRILGYSLGSAVALELARILAADIADTCKAASSSERTRGRGASSMSASAQGRPTTPEFSVTLGTAFENLPVKPELHLGPVVLFAPFTSVADWAVAFLRIPKLLRPWTVPLFNPLLDSAGVSWDNVRAAQALCATVFHEGVRDRFPNLKICIAHGRKDRIVPFWMGKRLLTTISEATSFSSNRRRSASDPHHSHYPVEYKAYGSSTEQKVIHDINTLPSMQDTGAVTHRYPCETFDWATSKNSSRNSRSWSFQDAERILNPFTTNTIQAISTANENSLISSSDSAILPNLEQKSDNATSSSRERPDHTHIDQIRHKSNGLSSPNENASCYGTIIPESANMYRTASLESETSSQAQSVRSNHFVTLYPIDGDHHSILRDPSSQKLMFQLLFSRHLIRRVDT